MTRYDVAVVGLGAMGSASLHHLAKRGVNAVAFDRHAPPHTLGSTHGYTRIIREAYYEHPLYVPLVQRAYELWDDLQRETQQQLWVRTGGLMVGPEKGDLFRGARASAEMHKLAHEILTAREIETRFPAYRTQRDWIGLLEQRAGMLFPERCVAAHLSRTGKTSVRTNETVLSLEPASSGVRVATTAGTYEAERVVVAAGPWLPELLPSLDITLPLEIERQMSHWFQPESSDAKYTAAKTPVGLWEMSGADVFATLPDEGHGVKCGVHHDGRPTSPDSVDRTVSAAENENARALLEQVMPGAGGQLKEARVCLYTNTPDHHFIVDWAAQGRVLIVSPCSGHGFKFASAIGEIVSQLVVDGKSWLNLAPFSLSRFH